MTSGLRDHGGFTRFWAASTVSDLGTYVTTLALQVLVVVTLGGTATDVGLVNAARWLPYLVLGLVAGVLADRWRRRPVLVSTDLGRAVLLATVPALAWAGLLTVPLLLAVMLLFGALSVLNDAASQSFLPRLVPRALLGPANVRLQQSTAVAQTSGPVVAGGLVSWVGAPAALLVDAVSYAVSGLLTATVRATDPRPPRAARRGLAREIREGLAWVYGHRVLRPMALAGHGWFLCSGVLGTVYVPFVLLALGFDAFTLGVTFALAGVGALLGNALSIRLGRTAGYPSTIAGARLVEALGFALVALAPAADAWPAWVLAGLGQFLFGLGLGGEGPIEMAYRQAVTPDGLQGRMNATMRSLNRAAVVVGAPLGGLLADTLGYRPALWAGVVGLAAGAVALRFSAFRTARADDAPPPDGPEPDAPEPDAPPPDGLSPDASEPGSPRPGAPEPGGSRPGTG
ncbi:MAG TPA: MFS transporter [Pseudonocardiaceae bacterium]